jgi:hypothetical protein
MIQISAFHVEHPAGEFIGIVAFDAQQQSAISAVTAAWGNGARYRELTADELRTLPSAGLSVFTATVQTRVEQGK